MIPQFFKSLTQFISQFQAKKKKEKKGIGRQKMVHWNYLHLNNSLASSFANLEETINMMEST